MEDSLDTYISPALIDHRPSDAAAAAADGDASEVFMQMLLSAVGAAPGDQALGAAATIDPSSLSAMDVDADGYAVAGGGDSAETNSLLAEALLSALGPLPGIAGASQSPGAPPPIDGLVAAAAATVGRQQQQPAAPKRPAPRPTATTAAGAPERTARTARPKQETPDDDDDGDDDGMEGVDLKSLSSKERRQLRNKISARNFRVRRKEYISNLEAEVRAHKDEADGLRRDLALSRRDNAQLRDEIQRLRTRLGALTTAARPATAAAGATAPVGGTAPVAATATMGGTATVGATAARPMHKPQPQPQPQAKPAPMVRFNPRKDVAPGAPAPASPAKKPAAWAAKNGRSITVNAAALPPAHEATAGALLAEARRKQAVDALLDMRPAAPTLAEALRAALLVAELVQMQLALESSLARPPAAAAAAPALRPIAVASC